MLAMTPPLMEIAMAIHEARKLGIEKTQYQLLAAMPTIKAALRLGYKHTQIHACLESQGIEWNLNYYRVLFNRAKAMSSSVDGNENVTVREKSTVTPLIDSSIEQQTNSATDHPDENSSVRTLISDELAKARAAGNVDYTRNKRKGSKK
jgi:hypothetical protein